jgi:hypothetical protein
MLGHPFHKECLEKLPDIRLENETLKIEIANLRDVYDSLEKRFCSLSEECRQKEMKIAMLTAKLNGDLALKIFFFQNFLIFNLVKYN